MKFLFPLSVAGIALLSACASPTPPTISEDDAAAINAEADRVGALPDTAIADLPPGSASFVGHAGGPVTGDVDGAVIADMTMDVEFAANTISGTIDNVNYLDEDDVPEQLLGGSLTIAGTEADGLLVATATGTLTAVGEESIRGSSSVTLNLNGNVLTDVSNGDTVFGDLDGSGSGDFDITLTDGVFYGSSN